ncbi:hypothetical protein VN97_g10228 [Penicillium thymicola]|uniref:Uncharacterized protein n=1 Tax=Penicillium thymicola TaxID=293382 RepID=A0AAI9T9C6_PENTH|nr:hypothetical protein VN97_g10228 [Penicillium thymicola]
MSRKGRFLHIIKIKFTKSRHHEQKEIVVPEGVEPSTLTLLASHSNQLSYGTDYDIQGLLCIMSLSPKIYLEINLQAAKPIEASCILHSHRHITLSLVHIASSNLDTLML